jgi:hypothetical protein
MSDLVGRLLGPDEPELSCDACFERLDTHVDSELRAGAATADAEVPGMRAHLAGCQACAEEHASLRALAADDPRDP